MGRGKSKKVKVIIPVEELAVGAGCKDCLYCRVTLSPGHKQKSTDCTLHGEECALVVDTCEINLAWLEIRHI